MPKKSEWPKGTDLQTTKISIPRRLWEGAKIRAMKENRTLQELIAEALEGYLRKTKKGGDRR